MTYKNIRILPNNTITVLIDGFKHTVLPENSLYETLYNDPTAIKVEEVVIPEQTLDEAKVAKVNEINSASSASIIEGFWYQSDTMEQALHFSYDNSDQINISSAMNGVNLYISQIAANGVSTLPDSISWNGYTDLEHTNLVSVVFTAESFTQFWGYSELAHKNGLIERARLLKEAVTNATTVEEVQAIQWG